MWATILEKAWAKVKGSYSNGEGGFISEGVRSLIGAPAFRYTATTLDTVDEIFRMIEAADELNYIMGCDTSGHGDDSDVNVCGLATSHAYSLLTAFTMTDSEGETHDMVVIRNPWGTTVDSAGRGYKDHTNWTDDLVSQVPYGLDPRTDGENGGMFVLPKRYLITEYGCIQAINIIFYRDDDGYTDDWYDGIDMDEEEHVYKWTIPEDAVLAPGDGFYFTVESYYSQVIPMDCFYRRSVGVSGHPLYYF